MSKKLLKLIPSQIRIKSKIAYEVVWIDTFEDSNILGMCRYDEKQIVLKKGQSNTETLKSFIHECYHAVSFESPKLQLTERQVLILEEETFRIFKLNGWLGKVLDLL